MGKLIVRETYLSDTYLEREKHCEYNGTEILYDYYDVRKATYYKNSRVLVVETDLYVPRTAIIDIPFNATIITEGEININIKE